MIDLNGYSRPSRLPLFALRPAPVQVAWFNMFATSGLECFDYLLGDQHVIPHTEEGYYTEKVVRVPGSYLTFEVTYPVPDVSPPPCLIGGNLTFGCLAPQYKITTEVVKAWSRILVASPRSRLILKNVVLGKPAARDFVRELFEGFGVPADRVDLEGPAEHFTFLERYQDIDVALDTFPYNGGTTTMEALWQGVPVLTFSGDRWAAESVRLCSSRRACRNSSPTTSKPTSLRRSRWLRTPAPQPGSPPFGRRYAAVSAPHPYVTYIRSRGMWKKNIRG